MGNWLKNFLESQKLSVSISGSKGVEDKTLKNSDIVFVSVPISKAPDVIKDTSKRVNNSTLLVDLSSVQTEVAKALRETNLPSCCLHLLFGPTITSIQNQKIILNRIKNHRLIGEIKNILEDAGAVIFDMNEVEHDKYMAHIQNLTHFMNISLAKTLLENKVELSGKISTPPFLAQLSALSRIISQPSTLLTEIQLNNSLAIKVLNQYIENQKEIIELIKLKNVETLKKELEKIHQKLDSTPKEKQVRQTKNTEDKKIRLNGKVGYLGPKGTFSHQAALGVVQDNQLTACDSIYQIFEAVSTGRVDFGIVPAENSTEGTIRETLDYLIDLDLKTNGSIDLDIHQNLLSNEQKLDDITSVISHPQALAQCRQWLGNNLPNAKIQTAASTVSSITENKDKKGVAFIGSKLAASLNDIKVLKENIEDNKNNITKFYIISDDIERINFDTKKTVLFLTVFNRVGILRDILNVFASSNINLSKIESRPSREKVWDYHFFIEVEVSKNDERLIQSLNILKQYCPVIKTIGGV